jgi:hypothetical protein
MKLFWRTFASATIATTPAIGGLSTGAEAFSLSGASRLKDESMKKVSFDLISLWESDLSKSKGSDLPQDNSLLQWREIC